MRGPINAIDGTERSDCLQVSNIGSLQLMEDLSIFVDAITIFHTDIQLRLTDSINNLHQTPIHISITMKISVLAFACVASTAVAFAPSPMASQSATALNLFGGKKEGGGEAPGPMGGMMDQLAMFKKAQEIAAKKGEIEKELKLINFEGKSENGKVEVTMKYLPSGNPMDPQPEFEVQGFDFDGEWFEGAAPDEISTASTEAYRAAVQATMTGSEEKFKALAEDLQAMMGGAAGPPQ